MSVMLWQSRVLPADNHDSHKKGTQLGGERMRRKSGVVKVLLGCATGAIVAAALGLTHQLFSARLAGDEPITVKGYVTKIEWTSPHA